MGISRAINLRERVHLSSRDGFLCVPEGRELNWTVDQFVENFSDHGVSVNDTQVRGIGRRLHVGNAYEVTIWDVDCRIGMSEVMRCINHHRLIAGSYQGQFLVRELCESVLPAGICFFPRSEEHTSELQSRENLVCRL